MPQPTSKIGACHLCGEFHPVVSGSFCPQAQGLKDKSIMDGMQIKENSAYKKLMNKKYTPAYTIVGHCTKCGSPSYGSETVGDELAPVAKRSCDCFV